MRILDMKLILEDFNADQVMGNMASDKYLYHAPEAHMGDESSLKLFLNYVKDGYNGHDLTFLDMWDHGSAFGSFGNDSNFNADGLTMQETDNALSSAGASFDIIGYDACLNANFELSSVIKKYADTLIASAETEPGHGWDYETVIQDFTRSESIEELYTKIIDDFVTNPNHKQDGKTLSAVDLRSYDELSSAVDKMAKLVTDNLDNKSIKDLIFKVHNPYSSNAQVESYGKKKGEPATTYDMTTLATEISNNSEGELQSSAKAVLDILKNKYILYAKSDSTKPNAFGVTIAPMMDGGRLKKSQIPSESYFALIDTIYNDYNKSDVTQPNLIQKKSAQASELSIEVPKRKYHRETGTSAYFTDDNLKKVTTLYGNVFSEENGEQVFASVAELQTFSTDNENEYYTPTWNQQWFLIKYGATEEESSPLFLSFTRSYTDKDTQKKYTIYSAEIDYINPKKEYTNQEKIFDWARLDIKVSEDGEVVSNSIHPYKILYASEGDEVGHVVFDKNGKSLSKDDEIRMLSYNLNLTTKESYWNEESDFIKLTSEPSFIFETLQFDDTKGNPLDYYYLIMAEDLAGNIATTDPINADK